MNEGGRKTTRGFAPDVGRALPLFSPKHGRPETLGRGERVRASPCCMRAYVRSPVCVTDIRPRRGCAEVAARAGGCGLPPGSAMEAFRQGRVARVQHTSLTIFIGSEIPFPVQPTPPPSDMRRDDRGRDERRQKILTESSGGN